jgi:UDP-N-acetylglucosamine 2-epimerase (non-hydrolysing)
VVIVVGTRPEAIKLLPIIRELVNHEMLQPFIVSTGQHADQVRQILALADAKPDVELDVGRPGIGLNEVFTEVMKGIDTEVRRRFGEPPPPQERMLTGPRGYPTGCLVHGDTTSAAAAALASFHLRMPVTHIEAGLRTYSTLSPFPEELNRQIITRIAVFHLAPTNEAERNLVREGVSGDQIFVTGNTGIDAVLWAADMRMSFDDPVLENLPPERPVVVVTAHRRENWGAGLRGIGRAVAGLAERHPDTLFVVALHPNPQVAQTLRAILEDIANVHLTEALPYGQFARLLRRARLAISDSGGIQEEAPALGTPVLVTRMSTERTEGVVAGTIQLVGTDPEIIVSAADRLLRDERALEAMRSAANPYGDGRAAIRIVQALSHLALQTPAPQPFGYSFQREAVIRAAGYQLGQLQRELANPDMPSE